MFNSIIKNNLMKTMSIIRWVLVVMGVISMTACNKIRIEGNHNQSVETRAMSGFSQVRMADNFEVDIHKDSVSRVEIHAETNIIPHIKTEISGNVLNIGTKGKHLLKPTTGIHVDVFLPDLTGIYLSGSGSITTDTFATQTMDANISGSGNVILRTQAQQLYADISGSGSMELVGSAHTSELTISGSGDIRGLDMLTNTCYASISGSGKIYVSVVDLLDVHISGSGSVYYIGHPIINSNITGSGQVVSY
jgi:hypothetical protein